MAVALVVGVAYTFTMELIKQKKIDLNGLVQEQELRPTPKVEHPNEWPRKAKSSIDPKAKSELPSTPQQSHPKDINTRELELEQSQTELGCSTPPRRRTSRYFRFQTLLNQPNFGDRPFVELTF